MSEQPRLRIQRTFPRDMAKRVVEILMECEEGPTFGVRRVQDGNQITVWMSKRTYDFLRAQLTELRKAGRI